MFRKDFAVSVGHSRGVPLSCTPCCTGTVACCGACQKSTCSATVNTVKLMSILVTFLHIVTKYWARNNLKEEGFLLSHGLRKCSPSRQGRHSGRNMRWCSWYSHNLKVERTGSQSSCNTSSPTPTDPLPPERLYLLKFPQLPGTAPPSGDQGFEYINHRKYFILQP